MKIVVSASSFSEENDRAMNLLLERNIEVIKNPYGRKLTPSETIDHLRGADGLLAGLEVLNEEVLSKAPMLRAISRIGVGVENVDFEYTKRMGIRVSNTPEAPTAAVAEMTLAALLTIGRQIIPCNTDMHNGVWKKRMGLSVLGLNVLIIGYGRIGKRVGEMLSLLGANITFYDPAFDDKFNTSLEELVKDADIITLHASGKEEILTPPLISIAKPGIVVLNSARGLLVNEDALCEALNSGKIAYYWADVFPEEPYSGRLLEYENAILTPHVSTYSKQCRESMEEEAVLNILEDLSNV
jgi:D-3-phosphoglycerate dehydrogenase